MNVTKKRFACLLLALGMMVALCACDLGTKKPTTTSADWSLYAKNLNGQKTVVNGYGQPEYDYNFDKKGNVIDVNKTVIISAENVADFIDVSAITLDDKSSLDIQLDTQIVEVADASSGVAPAGGAATRVTEPIAKNVRVRFNIAPENAMCKSITATSTGAKIIDLTGADSDGKVTLIAPANDSFVTLDFLAKDEGLAKIGVVSADGAVKEEFDVNITLNDKPINEAEFMTPATQVQQPELNDITGVQESDNVTSEVTVTTANPDAIPTTENTPGWINGSKVNLREEPSTTSDIKGTYTSGKPLFILGSANGWSKVQIDDKIGYVKTVYVTLTDPNAAANQTVTNSNGTTTQNGATAVVTTNGTNNGSYTSGQTGNRTGSGSSGSGSQGTSNPVNQNAPAAANDGQDHGYAFSTEASPVGRAGHEHDYKVASVVEPTETSSGYTIYQCGCGATYRGDFTDYTGEENTGHTHEYRERVIAPTCDQVGYTVYTCACGDSYRDDFVNPTGHSFETTDLPDGSVEYTCTECGYSFIDEG